MEELIKFIKNYLSKYEIQIKVSKKLKKLIKDEKIDFKSSKEYNLGIFLKEMSKKNKIFEFIYKKHNRIYDTIIKVPVKTTKRRQIKSEIIKNFGERLDFIFIQKVKSEFVIFIRYDLNIIYKEISDNPLINKYYIPYFIVYKSLKPFYDFSDIIFCDLLIENNYDYDAERQKYFEIIEHLKSFSLPLKIIDYFCFSNLFKGTSVYNEVHDCFVQLESSKKWPSDYKGRQIAKTAFYCLLYTKSKYRLTLEEDSVFLKYKNSIFRIRIRVEEDFNVEDKMNEKLFKIVKKHGFLFKDSITTVKKIICAHGFYPLILDDFLIEIICIILYNEEYTPSGFLKKFLQFDFNLENKILDLETLKITQIKQNGFFIKLDNNKKRIILPENGYLTRLQLLNKKIINAKLSIFNEKFDLLTGKLLIPYLKDYDLIFSRYKRFGFETIENKKKSDFAFGCSKNCNENKFLKDLMKYGFVYYSPICEILMLKLKSVDDIPFITNVIISKTSFECYKINN